MNNNSDHNKYLCFTIDAGSELTAASIKDVAIACFFEQYHAEPARVFECDERLWVGPVPDSNAGGSAKAVA
jgi:hypothetical protein